MPTKNEKLRTEFREEVREDSWMTRFMNLASLATAVVCEAHDLGRVVRLIFSETVSCICRVASGVLVLMYRRRLCFHVAVFYDAFFAACTVEMYRP